MQNNGFVIRKDKLYWGGKKGWTDLSDATCYFSTESARKKGPEGKVVEVIVTTSLKEK